ncbi:MAG: hypothetical protein M3O20_03345 [Acidobacteriota bacterium]|nr:hypothetical protein [Acidobacteriota bacterium]
MPRKARREAATPIDPSTLYSLAPLTDAELEILRMAEMMIRRRKLRLQVLSEADAVSWAWNAFIEALGELKACIEIGLTPGNTVELTESQMRMKESIVRDYQNTHGGRPIEYTTVLNEIDKLSLDGIGTQELIFRLQGDAAKPRVHYAESWTVEASGLFDVKAART